MGKSTFERKIFVFFNTALLILFSVICLYPILYVTFGSFSDANLLMEYKGLLWRPIKPTLAAYRAVSKNKMVLYGYANTLFVVGIATTINIVMTTIGAYILSRKNVMLRKALMIYIMITMYFSGGIIPCYLNIRNLGLYDSLWSLILPAAINTYNLIIMKTSFDAVPDSLTEAATIDGAGHATIMFRVILPLAKAMGTVLELAKDVNPNELIDNRAAYNNYAVWVPVRNDDGTYSKKLTLISEHKKVYEGYMPLTKENISKVVFSALGNTYGWGGSLNSDDCSGYMRNVYKCFGMELARNTTWQSSMPMAKVNMQYMPKEEKIKFFDALPFGTILYFSGHEMMYLGERNEKYYVISAVGTIMQPENPSVRQRIRSTIVNTLDVKRANGNTWFDELTVALVPYFNISENALPEYDWYHDGVAYCLKNKIMQGDENKFFNPSKNITWAELLQILYNMEETKPEYEFEEDAAWYAGAVKWAKDSELIYENDKDFDPESAISREQLASVLYLYAQFKGYDVSVGEETNILSYDDAFDISEYAIPAMQYVIGAGIINGKTIGTVNPKDNATRAEIAVILHRFIEKTKEI